MVFMFCFHDLLTMMIQINKELSVSHVHTFFGNLFDLWFANNRAKELAVRSAM